MHQPSFEDLRGHTNDYKNLSAEDPPVSRTRYQLVPCGPFLTWCPALRILPSCTWRVEIVTRRVQIVQLSIHLRQLGSVVPVIPSPVIPSYSHVSARCRHSVFVDDAVYERGGVSIESLAKNFTGITNKSYLTTGLEILGLLGGLVQGN